MGGKRSVRKLIFVAVTFFLVVGIVELVSLVGLSLLGGRLVGLGALSAERLAIAGRAQQPTVGMTNAAVETEPWVLGMRQKQVLHPYLGFVFKPKDDLKTSAPRYVREGNSYGFPQNFYGFFSGIAPDDVVVAVVGGSVAHQIAAMGRPIPFLERALNRIPKFDGRNVKVLNFAVGGYKQPQQLALINYFLALGMHIDVLINIDGFNEVTLPVKDNLSVDVNPFYPRSWRFRVETIDSEERRLRGEISFLDSLRREVASRFSQTPLQYSFAAAFVWRMVDNKIRRWGAERETSLLERTSGDRNLETHGPPFEYQTEDSLFRDLVAVWRRCSMQMHSVAQGQGIAYFHFLQPNQYDSGSKELTSEELRTAWDPESSFVKSVAIGYPMLRDEGAGLRASGVRFVDLTGVFEDVDQALYVDSCCHFNADGVELLAEVIAEEIENADDME